MEYTASQIRCLLALLALSRQSEDIASKDVARLLGVSRPSVHKALDLLVENAVATDKPEEVPADGETDEAEEQTEEKPAETAAEESAE